MPLPSLRRLLAVSLVLAALGGLASTTAARVPDRLVSRPLPDVAQEKTQAIGDKVVTGPGQRQRLLLPDRSVVFLRERSSLTVIAADKILLSAGEAFIETAPAKLAPALRVQTPKRAISARGSRFGVRISDEGTTVLAASGEVRIEGVDDPVRAGQSLLAKAKKPTAAPRISHLVAWTRDLRTATPLVPASAHAGGSLIARDPDGQEARLELRRYKVDVQIEDGFARTTIDQTYFNHTQDRLEGTFRFPLPPDASLSRLAMYVDGKRMEGGMVERDHARSVYERIVWEQRDPALLEWVDGSTFKMRVFPLEARQEKRLLLSYTQRLPVLYGGMGYRFPAGHSFSQVGEWSLHVRVKGGAGSTWNSESHSLTASKDGGDLVLDAQQKNARLDRDVVLNLTASVAKGDGEQVRFAQMAHDGQRYLMVRYRPALEGSATPERRDWVVLVETSGDRDPLLARTQVELVRSLLSYAGREDTFTLVTAATRTRKLQAKPAVNNVSAVEEAMAELEKAHLVGAFDLGKALNDVRPVLEAGKTPYLLHVGSGIAAMGVNRTDELLQRLPKGVRYVGVGVGKRWNRAFMQAAAERTGGYFTQVNPDEPVAWRGMDLAMTLNTPRLLDVGVSAGKRAFLPFVRMVSQGEELAAVTRFTGDLPETVRITGKFDGKEFVRDLPVKDVQEKAAYLPRSWAKLEIDRLLAEDARKHKEGIVALSKAMYVMTPFTSLLVLENDDMYKRFNVDRGRKDHWAMYPAPAKIKVVFEPIAGDAGDPKKGIKPSARVVSATVVTRPMQFVLYAREVAYARTARGPTNTELFDALFNLPAGFWTQPRPSTQDRSAPPLPSLDGAESGVPLSNNPDPNAEARRLFGRGEYSMSESLPSGRRALTIKVNTGSLAGGFILPGSHVDVVFTAPGKEGASRVLLQNTQVLALDTQDQQGASTKTNLGQTATLAVTPEVATRLSLAAEAGDLRLVLRNGSFSAAPTNAKIGTQAEAVRGSLLYTRPKYSNDQRLFYDLLASAPGLDSTPADLRAVVEAEARVNPSLRPGAIPASVQKLFAKARSGGWRSLTVPGDVRTPTYRITFDGAGRYAWERTLSSGLRERVVCDGKTLWHLYPELGLAANRTVSRFHRLEFTQSVPWTLPLPGDLAHGNDLMMLAADTVAVVPHGAKEAGGKPVPHVQMQVVFKGGVLVERRMVQMPAKKVLRRATCFPGGIVAIRDSDDKEFLFLKRTLEESREPSLKVDVKNLVVLDLPFRTPAHVRQTMKIDNKGYGALTFDEARQLLTAFVGVGDAEQAKQVFQLALANREQRQLGYYVLLAAAGVNLDSDNIDVLDAHPHEPLAQYLALHSSPVLRKHASRWAAASNSWGDGLLRRLGMGHALCQRWASGKSLGTSVAQRQGERERALAYVKQHKGTALAWALLGLVQDRTAEEKEEGALAAYRELAAAYALFIPTPGLGDHARYEQARCLWKAGQKAEARKRFLTLYEKAVKQGVLLAIDADFRAALLSGKEDGWSALLRRTASRLVKENNRLAVLLLARQAWQLDDAPMAQTLFSVALKDVPLKGKESLLLQRAGLAFLMETSQTDAADQRVRKLLEDADNAKNPGFWHAAAKLAGEREMPARRLECLEKALELEFAHLPEVINLEKARGDYSSLLGQYAELAKALATLKLPAPVGFRDKVVRAADRWRALDRDQEKAATAAASVLRGLGERELAWDYLTTPVALRPGESDVWITLADTLKRQGERDLADRAYQAAFERESTNAQVLWDRADNLRKAGRLTPARTLYRQIAEGDWQPRFAALKTQAQWMLEGR